MVTEIGETNCALVSAVPPREKIDCETPSVDDASQHREPVLWSSARMLGVSRGLFGVPLGNPLFLRVWVYVFGSD